MLVEVKTRITTAERNVVMNECEMCHGTGSIPCPTCNGEKTEPCKKCNGTGNVPCTECDEDGEVACDSCEGCGKKVCPVCNQGKVKKSRIVNCPRCHGKGQIWHSDIEEYLTCWSCDGSGQRTDYYWDICPNCHGDYTNYSNEPCPECEGEGYFTCETCHGTRHVKCPDCEGSGHLTCSHCNGSGSEKCPACEQREKERKEKEAREAKERKEKEARKAEERRKEAYEKEQARRRKKKRVRNIFGILWRILLSLVVGFLFWWWFEGFNKEALSGILEQVKGVPSGISKNLKLALMVSGGTFVALYLFKLIRFIVLIHVITSIIGGISAAVLITSGHWGVGGLMALLLLAAISERIAGKAHENWWRWILMGIGLFVSGAFGMHGNWIISSLISAFSVGVVLKDPKDED